MVGSGKRKSWDPDIEFTELMNAERLLLSRLRSSFSGELAGSGPGFFSRTESRSVLSQHRSASDMHFLFTKRIINITLNNAKFLV